MMKIVFASHTNLSNTFKVGSHHLAYQLANRGHEVLHISTPVSLFHFLKLKDRDMKQRLYDAIRGPRQVAKGLYEYIPFAVFPAMSITEKLMANDMNVMLRTIPSIRKLLKKIDFVEADALIIDQPSFMSLWKYIKSEQVIYRPTDLYHNMKHNGDIITKIEEKIVAASQAVVATSHPVGAYIQSINRTNVPIHIIANGVDIDAFPYDPRAELPQDIVHLPSPRAIYVGSLDERFGKDAVKHIAETFPNLTIVIIGPYTKTVRDYFVSSPNIHLLGRKPYDEISKYLNHSDIAILPLSDQPSNKGRSPMKIYEYMSTGLPVVASWTPELAAREDPYVYLGKDSFALANHIQHLLDHPYTVNKRREVSLYAQQFSWSTKGIELEKLLRSLQDVS